MKAVAKVFVILNEILLFIFAILLPAIGLLIAFTNPSAVGLGFSPATDSFWTIIFALVVWEVLVVISFGLIAITIENYNNLKKIAESVSQPINNLESYRNSNSVASRNTARTEPKLRALDSNSDQVD